jgi:hypothetical protein
VTRTAAKATDDDVFAFVSWYRTAHGYAPSIQDIADGLGIVKSTAKYRVDALVRDGRLRRDSRARSIVVVDEPGRLVWDKDRAVITK